jgi:hypothetical protein
MFGSGEGYWPGQQSYRIDHLAVPASRFMEEINTGMHGGSFGLLEMAARMSAREIVGYSVSTPEGPVLFRDLDDALAYAGRIGVNTVDRWIQYNDWQVISSLIPIANLFQQVGPTPLSGDNLSKWESERNRLLRLLGWIGDKGKTECRKFLERIGFDVQKIKDSLANQTPYDAFESKNDANEDFGHYGISVAEFFNFWGKEKFQGGAATGNTGRIYYSSGGITLAVILHETLHAAFKGKGTRNLYAPENPRADPTTGVVSFGPGSALISDKELQEKLGVALQLDTTNITKELEKNGCK